MVKSDAKEWSEFAIAFVARILGEAHEPLLAHDIQRKTGFSLLETDAVLRDMVRQGYAKRVGKRYAAAHLDFPKKSRAKRAMRRPTKSRKPTA